MLIALLRIAAFGHERDSWEEEIEYERRSLKERNRDKLEKSIKIVLVISSRSTEVN